ncbi:hypothetical protein F5141DRAFT_1213448 [Pisolithus sp. B1]|nr:hypothetical protein F5141DRAFT_1213448 [Pisolithus sp. B1]
MSEIIGVGLNLTVLFSEDKNAPKPHGRPHSTKSDVYGAIADAMFKDDVKYADSYVSTPHKFHDSVAHHLEHLKSKYHEYAAWFVQTGNEHVLSEFPWFSDLHGLWRAIPSYSAKPITSAPGIQCDAQLLSLVQKSVAMDIATSPPLPLTLTHAVGPMQLPSPNYNPLPTSTLSHPAVPSMHQLAPPSHRSAPPSFNLSVDFPPSMQGPVWPNLNSLVRQPSTDQVASDPPDLPIHRAPFPSTAGEAYTSVVLTPPPSQPTFSVDEGRSHTVLDSFDFDLSFGLDTETQGIRPPASGLRELLSGKRQANSPPSVSSSPPHPAVTELLSVTTPFNSRLSFRAGAHAPLMQMVEQANAAIVFQHKKEQKEADIQLTEAQAEVLRLKIELAKLEKAG